MIAEDAAYPKLIRGAAAWLLCSVPKADSFRWQEECKLAVEAPGLRFLGHPLGKTLVSSPEFIPCRKEMGLDAEKAVHGVWVAGPPPRDSWAAGEGLN